MAQFRAETKLDPVSGMHSLEVYYPADAEEPLVSTDPIYPTMDAAEADFVNIVRKAFGKPVRIVDVD